MVKKKSGPSGGMDNPAIKKVQQGKIKQTRHGINRLDGCSFVSQH